jgi:hypothetical protein
MFFLANRSKIYVKRFSMEDGSFQGVLFAFNGKIKNDLISRFKENYNVEGDYIKDGGRISPQSILALIGTGGGALGLSAAASGQLFLATANPTTLMTIGNGVGSAVMGAGGHYRARAIYPGGWCNNACSCTTISIPGDYNYHAHERI